MNNDWIGTTKLRWLRRPPTDMDMPSQLYLQQWHAPDVQGYMRDPNVGEWRDVEVVAE